MSFMYILPSKHLAVSTFSSGDTKILIHGAGQGGPGHPSLLKSMYSRRQQRKRQTVEVPNRCRGALFNLKMFWSSSALSRGAFPQTCHFL